MDGIELKTRIIIDDSQAREAGPRIVESYEKIAKAEEKTINSSKKAVEQSKTAVKQTNDFRKAVLEKVRGVRIAGLSIGDLENKYKTFKAQMVLLRAESGKQAAQFLAVGGGAKNLGAAATVGTAGLKSLTVGWKLLNTAFKLSVIGTVIAALVSLISFLTTTQEGIDAVNSVLIPLKEIFKTFTGILQQIGKSIFDAFKDVKTPGEFFKALGELIQDNLINRFNAAIELFKNGGSLIGNVFKVLAANIKISLANVPILGKAIDLQKNLDIIKKGSQEIQKSFLDLSKAAVGISTGLNPDSIEKYAGQLKNAAKDGSKLAALAIQIEKAEINLAENRERLLLQATELRKQGLDVNNSLAERRKATKQAAQASEELIILEQALLDLKIEQTELSFKANDTNRADELELAKLKGQQFKIENQQKRLQIRLQTQLTSIEKEQSAIASKAAAELKKLNDEFIKSATELRNINRDAEIGLLTATEQIQARGEIAREAIEKQREALLRLGEEAGRSSEALAGINAEFDKRQEALTFQIQLEIINEESAARQALENTQKEINQGLEAEFKAEFEADVVALEKQIAGIEFTKKILNIDLEVSEIAGGEKFENKIRSSFENFGADLQDTLGFTDEGFAQLTDLAQKELSNFIDFSTELFLANTQAKIDAAEAEIALREENIDKLKSDIEIEQDLKDRGITSDVSRLQKQLAEEEKLKADAENKRLENEKKIARQQLLIDSATNFSSRLSIALNLAKESSKFGIGGAFIFAGLLTAFELLIKGAFKSSNDNIPALAAGTDKNVADTLGKDKRSRVQDGYLARIDGKEKLMSIQLSEMLDKALGPNVTTKEIADRAINPDKYVEVKLSGMLTELLTGTQVTLPQAILDGAQSDLPQAILEPSVLTLKPNNINSKANNKSLLKELKKLNKAYSEANKELKLIKNRIKTYVPENFKGTVLEGNNITKI